MAGKLVSDHLEPWRCLAGKVVMVTGASSGIGWDICLDLASAGCKVIAAARRIDRLRLICDQMNGGQSSEEIRAVGIELDVNGDGPSIESAVKKAWEAFGTIDAVINNAGVRGTVKNCIDLSEDEWDNTMKTNLKGTWLVSKYVCSHMRDSKKQGGSIINISSIAGLNRGQLPGSVAYTSSKAAVNSLTKIMAVELGEFNIRVNSINPGLFRSEITQGLMEKEWINNIALRTIPLRSTGTVQPDLTSIIRYLIHDSSAYISGNVFIADAGATLPGVPLFSSL